MKKSTRAGLGFILASPILLCSAGKTMQYETNTCEEARANPAVVRVLKLEEVLPKFNPSSETDLQKVKGLQSLLDHSDELKEYHSLISQKEVMNSVRNYELFCGNIPITVFPFSILTVFGIFSASVGVNYLRGKYDKPYFD